VENLPDTTSEPKPAAAVLVIGACHEYQRHQDADAERERIRGDFENLIRAKIAEGGIGLIAEEAARDEQVHAQLQDDAAKSHEFDGLFPAVVSEPQETIAKLLADELLKGNYADIRPPNADKMTIPERDEAMATKTMKSLGSVKSVLVICGERHRAGLARHLVDRGLRLAESLRFPDRCADEAENAQ
jgi:pheromone shutdown protein TraB